MLSDKKKRCKDKIKEMEFPWSSRCSQGSNFGSCFEVELSVNFRSCTHVSCVYFCVDVRR